MNKKNQCLKKMGQHLLVLYQAYLIAVFPYQVLASIFDRNVLVAQYSSDSHSRFKGTQVLQFTIRVRKV